MIKTIQPIETSIPLTITEPPQSWESEWGFQLYVKVKTESQTGWGETLASSGNFSDPYVSLINRLSESIIGDTESKTEEIWNKMRRLTFTGGYGIATAAMSSIDVALWDINSKASGKNLSQFLGGTSEKVERYISLSRYSKTEDLCLVVRRLLQDGFKKIKLHQGPSNTIEAIKAIRNESGNELEIAVDLNSTLDHEGAVRFANGLHKYDPLWLEEPVWPPDDYKTMKEINEIVPLAAGENAFSYFEFERLIEMNALTYYQPDISKVGGITPAIQIFKLIAKNREKLAPHSRPDNGWISTIVTATLLSGLNLHGIVETPPNSIPSKYFTFDTVIDSEGITPGGLGIGIAPKATLPKMISPKVLRF